MRTQQQTPFQPRAINAEVIYVPEESTSVSNVNVEGFPEKNRPHLNLQRNPVSTTVATVPIIVNKMVFEDGLIDSGATNTMISQSAARQLNLIDQIEPSRLKYSCADGKLSAPWGIIMRLPVGVEGLCIPIDVFVSGATSYDVLLATDWLTQAHAKISFAKQEMSFPIDPQLMGRVPIRVMPAGKCSTRFCSKEDPTKDPGDPEGPEVPAQLELTYIESTTSEDDDPEESVPSEGAATKA